MPADAWGCIPVPVGEYQGGPDGAYLGEWVGEEAVIRVQFDAAGRAASKHWVETMPVNARPGLLDHLPPLFRL